MNKPKKTLLVLRTIDQLSMINSLVPDWQDKSVTVISGHPTVDIELRKQGVPFTSLFDVVPSRHFGGIETEVNELTDIFTDILQQLWPDAPLMIEGLRPNADTIVQDIVRSVVTIETLFQELNPDGVWIVSNVNVPRILDVELSSDIFDAMLLQHVEDKGLPVNIIRQPVPISNPLRQIRDILRKSIFGPYLRRLGQWVADLKGRTQGDFVIPPKTSLRRVMLLGADFDFENQLPLVRRINQGDYTEAIHIFLGDPRHWMQPDSYDYMSENPEAWVDYDQFTSYYSTRYMAYQPLGHFLDELKGVDSKWQKWLSSPYLDFQFEWLFEDGPKRILRDAARWGTLFNAYKPDIVVLMQDSTYHYAGQSVALKRLGIKSVLLPHSAIVNASPSASRFLSEQAFVWGEIMRDELIEIGVDPARLHIAGTIKPMQQSVHLNDREREQRLMALGLNPQRKTLVMVTSGSFERWMRPYVDIKAHLASIEAVIQYVSQRADVQLIIKTHPRRDYPVVYNEMLSRLGDGNDLSEKVKVITEADLFSILAVADIIIVPGTHTTAALEALVTEQPLIYLSTAHIYDKGFSWGRYGGCLVIDALDDITPSLDRVLDDGDFRGKLVAEGKKLLEKYYHAEGIESVSLIYELLMQV
ncbi:hypothetical protein ACFLUO_03865 [Chloroflexota bacterium]